MKIDQLVIVVSIATFLAKASGEAVVLTPQGNRAVPVDYNENITSSCFVQDSLQVVWKIGTTQIFNLGQFLFQAARGIFINPPSFGPRSSTITFSASELLANNFTQVECLAYNSSSGEIYSAGGTSSFYLITYVAPSAVRGLDLEPTLSLEWNRPSVPAFADIPTDYMVEINATEEDGMNFRISTSNTSFSVQFLEDMLHNSERACVEFEFIVSATNDAGTGPLARIKDTVPISPDVRNVSRDLTVVSVDVQAQTAQILFPPVMPCSVNFSLTNYTINIDGDMNRTLTPGEVTLGEPLTIRNLVLDASLSLTITACNSVTCRTSDQRTLNTTDVQSVQVVFFGNHLFLNCSFADGTQARGCVFEFVVISTNGTDRHNVSHQGLRGSNCTEAPYRLDAYGNMFVMDWEENGMVGSVPLNITNTTMVMNITNAEEYTDLTGCSVDEVQPTIQTNVAVIAGSSLGVVAFITVLVVVAIVVIAIIIKKRGSSFSIKKFFTRTASDSGEMEDLPVLYECEINAGDFKDKMIESLGLARDEPPPSTFRYTKDSEQVIEMEPKVHVAMSSEPPPPPLSGDVSNSGVIEMPKVCDETKESMSSGPPPPPPTSGDINSTGVIEMPEESTVSGAPRVGFDHDSPEVSDDEGTAECAPLIKDVDKRVEQELEKRVKEELEKRVEQELDERVKQEVRNELTKEIDKRVRLEHHDPHAPLTLKVQWKSLVDSLLARGGNKDYNFSKLKVELEF